MPNNTTSHYQDFTNLAQWLFYLENLHSTEIDLGLARISEVAKRLNIDLSFAKVITVAGTNGKGTTCAFLENALLETESLPSRAKVAVYSSPHIEHFNERLRIDKVDITDQPLIDAFVEIEQARLEISLSYYEYTTLAALLVLMAVKPEYIILEVGLGGRLDATNIIDADVAVITTIDLDHQAFLGNTRELIGFEKAGIMRENQVIVVGDTDAPQSVINYAHEMKADVNDLLFTRVNDFNISSEGNALWAWGDGDTSYKALIPTYIPQDNVATAITVLKQLHIPLCSDFINQIIEKTRVAGRTELFSHLKQCDVMLDVGHNPQACRYLAQKMQQLKKQGKYENIYAVVSMLTDKDIHHSLKEMSEDIDAWYSAPLDVPRAATKELLQQNLNKLSESVNCFDNINVAFKMATSHASEKDLVLVFGSFFTVAPIRANLLLDSE